MKSYQIPFDADGNLLHYVGSWLKDVQWFDNFVFNDSLFYVGYSQNTSTININFKTSAGKKVGMSIRQFDLLIKKGKFQNNQITGDWTFVKRGNMYLIEEAV